MQEQKVAIITGANGGVGVGLCRRLLETQNDLKLIMACRNYEKAFKKKQYLLRRFPNADIDIEMVDLESVESVFHLCSVIIDKYPHVNYLFCNGATLSVTGINWKRSFEMLFTDIVGLVEKSEATTQIIGEVTKDGMGKVFQTNVFSHYIMMRELELMLSNSGQGRVIWTSSNTANHTCFDINDWQGVKCKEPYESSKWACDLISIATHERYEKDNKHISTFTTSPGVVASEIGNLNLWILYFRTILHYIMRWLGIASQNINGYYGAIADIYVAFQSLEVLNYLYRYTSMTTPLGKNYVKGIPIPNYDPNDSEELLNNCEQSYQFYKKKYSSRTALAPAVV